MSQHNDLKNKKYSVLFVDDERRILTALRSIFRREYEVYTANSGQEALTLLAKHDINVVVSDQRMPSMLGNELLAKVHKLYPQTMRVLLTGFMDKEAIIKTINEGEIYRFVNKPWNNDDMRATIAEAALASELTILPASDDKQQTQIPNWGNDNAVLMMEKNQEVRHQIRKFCQQNTIKIYGTQNIAQAVTAVSNRENIGVAIVELPVETEDTIATINLLKQQRPELISIVLTQETDAQTAVDLINNGQVFRYLSKPVENSKLEQILQQAFQRHTFLKRNGQSQKRYQVVKSKLSFSNNVRQLFSSFTSKVAT